MNEECLHSMAQSIALQCVPSRRCACMSHVVCVRLPELQPTERERRGAHELISDDDDDDDENDDSYLNLVVNTIQYTWTYHSMYAPDKHNTNTILHFLVLTHSKSLLFRGEATIWWWKVSSWVLASSRRRRKKKWSRGEGVRVRLPEEVASIDAFVRRGVDSNEEDPQSVPPPRWQ